MLYRIKQTSVLYRTDRRFPITTAEKCMMITSDIIDLLDRKPTEETQDLAAHVLLARGEPALVVGKYRKKAPLSDTSEYIPGAPSRLASDTALVRERARRTDDEITAERDRIYALYQSNPKDHTWLQLLAKTGDKRATEPIITVLNQRMDEFSRSQVLVSLGETSDPSAVDAIVPFLDHKSEMVRSSAAEALGKIGDARAIEPIRARLQKESVHEKVRKAWKRQQRGETVGESYFENLTKKASVQIALATALVQLGTLDAHTEMLHCLPFEDDQQTYHGMSPLPGLGMLGASVVPALIDVLQNDDDPFALIIASSALWDGGHASLAADALLPLLSYTDTHEHMEESVRGVAARTLGESGDRRATIPLCEMLSDERWMIESEVREALAKLADPQAAPYLAKHLTTMKRTGVYNTETLSALLACGQDAAYPPVAKRFATETDNDERIALIFALAWLNDKRALLPLRERLTAETSEQERTLLELAVDYLEAAPSDWLKPQWEA